MSASIEPKLLLQAFYLSATAAILLVYLTPLLSKRFLAYGARDAAAPLAGQKEESSTSSPPPTTPRGMSALLDRMADIKVPHGWFIHFYIVSVLSSALWAHQIITRGPLYNFLASFAPDSDDPDPCMRAAGCWLLLAIQGMRRLYECAWQPRGSSEMWIGHYAMGIAFYLATGIAVWIEALPALKAFHKLGRGLEYNSAPYNAPYRVPYQHESALGIPDAIFIWAFVDASLSQHKYHRHLASLTKYTAPTHTGFESIVAPHYSCECLIYLSLAILSRPSGHYLNHTMTASLVFVAINLGISADGTKQWMSNKFGDASVVEKWRMIPRVW